MTQPGDVVDALALALLTEFPTDAARELERASGADVAELLAALDPAISAAVVNALSASIARDVLVAMPTNAAADTSARLPVPWLAALLRAAPKEPVQRLLDALPAKRRAAISRAMAAPAGSAAALAEPAVLSLAPDVDAALALERARDPEVTPRDRVYVVDREGRLVGVAGIADLLGAVPTAPLSELMVTDVVTLPRHAGPREIAEHPGWRRWRTLPVVDRNRILQGVVRYDAVQRLILDEPPHRVRGRSLPLSLAELFWVGMAGITDGLARTVTATRETDDG